MEQTITNFEINNKKTINAWAFYDWANSAFFLVIATAIFPSYFLNYTDEIINIFGIGIKNTAFYTILVSLAYFIIVFTTPILSGIADYGGKRLEFLKIFTTVGSIACMTMFFFTSSATMWVGIAAFVISTIGCAGSLVFYDSFLPDIASEDMYDRVSAKGYTYGFIGSALLLVLILAIAFSPATFGIEDPQLPYQIGFILVGLWWLSFAQITFSKMPNEKKQITDSKGMFKKGFKELQKAFKKLKKQPKVRRYLYAFFFYSSGVQTVVYVASAFADKVLGFEAAELITIILILQLIAVPGTYLFAYLSKTFSSKTSLITAIIIWAIICLIAYLVHNKTAFYFLAGGVGIVLGGIQSISRSTYSKMLDPNESDTTCYYSFYDILYKISVVFGTLLFALMEILTNNMRNSVISLTFLFVISLVILLPLKKEDYSFSTMNKG